MGYICAGYIVCIGWHTRDGLVKKYTEMYLVVCSHEPNDDENQEECMSGFASQSTQIKMI